MSLTQVVRHTDADALVRRVAQRLVDAIMARQAGGHVVQLCLTGGSIAMRLYEQLATILSPEKVDPELLELWWGDERFVPTAHPDRLAGPTLALLARHYPINPAHTHPMPASDGSFDASSAALNYTKELDDTRFDICLLGIGPDGHVASIFPHHPSSEPTNQRVIAMQDSPKPPPERISLTIPTLNESAEVWFLASGTPKAAAVKAAIGGDTSIPAGNVHGQEATIWLIDQDAAQDMPYFDCSM